MVRNIEVSKEHLMDLIWSVIAHRHCDRLVQSIHKAAVLVKQHPHLSLCLPSFYGFCGTNGVPWSVLGIVHPVTYPDITRTGVLGGQTRAPTSDPHRKNRRSILAHHEAIIRDSSG